MATPRYNTYIGMRYVPIFDGEWNSTKTYEPLTIVSYQGNSYTSRTFIPVGMDINNTEYWALTGNYNAQVEYYRQETARVAEEVDRRIIQFEKVASMKDDTNLEDGFVCETLGYYNAGDGGNALYIIKETEPNDYYEELDNGLYAELLNKYEVTPVMFGAVGDGIADDTTALQNAVQAGRVINLINKEYKITDAITLTGDNVELFGGTITREAKQTFNTLDGSNCKNINIHDVIFEGNGNTSDVTYTWRDDIQACCILTPNGTNIQFSNNIVSDFNYGVFIIGSDEDSTDLVNGFGGSICNNIFQNCKQPVDTYGKNLNISYNTFLDITGIALQIEPVGTLTDEDEPYNSANDNTCGADCNIVGNYFRNISDWCIALHANTYAVNIDSNLFMDFDCGVTTEQGFYATITKNSFFGQKTQSVTNDTRPWVVKPAIHVRNGMVNDNYFRKVYTAIRVAGNALISMNKFFNILMSAISEYIGGDLEPNIVKIYDNELNGLADGAYWWGCRFISIGRGYAFIRNNKCVSERQPLYVADTNVQLQVENLQSNLRYTGSYTKYVPDYVIDDNNVKKIDLTSYLNHRSGGACVAYKVGNIVIISINDYTFSESIGYNLFSSAIPAELIPTETIYSSIIDTVNKDTCFVYTRPSGIFGVNGVVATSKIFGQIVYTV